LPDSSDEVAAIRGVRGEINCGDRGLRRDMVLKQIMKLFRHPEETQSLKALPTAFMSEAQAAAAHAVREPTIS
jgi:hypothetical protein